MTLIVGHRGAAACWPENSLTGFRQALAAGCRRTQYHIFMTL